MKKTFTLFSVAFIALVFSCSDESPSPTPVDPEETLELSERERLGARTPEGSGSGAPTNINGSGGGSSGYALTWNGDGRWVGNFAASPVWFWGPTPTQLQNGIQGEWPVACAYYTAGECYPDGFVVTGNGAGFTVQQPMCGTINIITMPKYTVTTYYTPTGDRIDKGDWTTATRSIQTITGGTCKLNYSGKIIVNEACKPVIVDIESTYPANLCGAYRVD